MKIFLPHFGYGKLKVLKYCVELHLLKKKLKNNLI